MLILLSTLPLILIFIGLLARRRPEIHVPCMGLAFLLDLRMLIYLELARNAAGTAVQELQAPADNMLLTIHVSASILVMLLYLVQIASGLHLLDKLSFLKNPRSIHKWSGMTFITMRLVNYVTSFWVA